MNFGTMGIGGAPVAQDPLNLNKGDILDLTKVAPSLHNVIIGCGWDVNESGSENFDLDISAFMLNAQMKVQSPTTEVVFFNAKNQAGIYLERDNLTGSGDGDDERIHVNLDSIPPNIQAIVFNVNIFEAARKRQTFGMVKNSYIRLLDEDDNEKELARFELKENAGSSTAVTFAKLFRTNNGWSFEALGQTLVVEDLNKLLLRYM